jgi:hypothetical protein
MARWLREIREDTPGNRERRARYIQAVREYQNLIRELNEWERSQRKYENEPVNPPRAIDLKPSALPPDERPKLSDDEIQELAEHLRKKRVSERDLRRVLHPDDFRLVVDAARGTGVPHRDRSGKCHDVPRDIGDDWTRDDMERAVQELEKSIARRQQEQRDFGLLRPDDRWGEDEFKHRRQIERERDLLRKLRKRLSGS